MKRLLLILLAFSVFGRADTRKTRAECMSILADGQAAGAISEQDVRDCFEESYLTVRFQATDCTSLTNGVQGDLCFEQDAKTLYSCVPTAGGCDTAGEWILMLVTDAQIPATLTRDSELLAHTGNTSNPHSVTAVQAGALPTIGTSVDKAIAAWSGTGGATLQQFSGCTVSVSANSKTYLTCDGGMSAGDGTYAGAWITGETTANGGAFQFAVFGPVAQTADRCWVYPDAQPGDNDILKGTVAIIDVVQDGKTWTGCRVMAWEADAGSGGPVTDDTVLLGNGTAGIEATIPACANATTSKLLYDQATNAFSCGTDQSGSGSSIDCYDPANSCLAEDFYAGAAGTSTIGALGWRETGSIFTYVSGEDGAPGIARIGTTTVLDNASALTLNNGSSNEPMLAMDMKTFTLQMRFRTGRTTEIGADVGIKDDATFAVNGDGFFLSFDTAAAETTYQYVVCNGTCYTVDSLAALSTLWRRVKITNDGGSVATFSLYDETGTLITGSTKTFCTAASGCDVNSVVFPTGTTLIHTFTVINRGATTSATLDADYFSFQMTGLSR